MRDKIVLKGEGPGMEVWYKHSKVDINSKISEYYDDEKLCSHTLPHVLHSGKTSNKFWIKHYEGQKNLKDSYLEDIF
jgi:hypothetical protein